MNDNNNVSLCLQTSSFTTRERGIAILTVREVLTWPFYFNFPPMKRDTWLDKKNHWNISW